MKALVTGGAGFIGSNLSRQLLLEGHEVKVLDNLLTGRQENLQDLPLEFIEGDICDDDMVDRAVKECEVVYHLAASVGNKRSIDQPIADSRTNVLGTLGVLEACRRHDVRKIVFSSSAGIFGELKTLPIDESHPCEPDSPYGAGKLCGEKQCLVYAKLYDLEAVALRYFNVYGPNQRFDAYGNVIPIFVFRLLKGEPITIFGDGEQTRDFVHVNDVVQANIRSSMTSRLSGAFNIGSGERVSINRLVDMIGRAIGTAAPASHGPSRAGDVRDSLADITAARNAFGFTPSVNLEEGLLEYVDWARSVLE
jgi:UDP-glucose 4-epimerase